jgi:hypothetical protein
LRHIGFLLVSNAKHKDFRYPLVRNDDPVSHSVKTPGGGTVPILLKVANSKGAKLLLNHDLEIEIKSAVRKVWGK